LENSPSKKNKKKKKERIVLPQNSICIVENPTSVLDENTDLWA
jgi:ABC-type sulfate transport system substrate-binding protein